MSKSIDHKFSCVYVTKKSGEISTVEVSLTVGKDKIKVFIQPVDQKDIEEDLPEILEQIEKSQLVKAGIRIIDDCEVYVVYKDIPDHPKKIEFSDKNFTIKK